MLSASLSSLCVDLPGCSWSPLRTSRRRTRRVERLLRSDRAPGADARRLERGRVKSEATRELGTRRGLLAANTTLHRGNATAHFCISSPYRLHQSVFMCSAVMTCHEQKLESLCQNRPPRATEEGREGFHKQSVEQSQQADTLGHTCSVHWLFAC